MEKEKWYHALYCPMFTFGVVWFIIEMVSESDYPTIAKPIAAAFITFFIIVLLHERVEIEREDEERRKIERGEE